MRPWEIPYSSLTLAISPALYLARMSALLCGGQLIFVVVSQVDVWGRGDAAAAVIATQPDTYGA